MKKILFSILILLCFSVESYSNCNKTANLFLQKLNLKFPITGRIINYKRFDEIPGYCFVYYGIKNAQIDREMIYFVVTNAKYSIPSLLKVEGLSDKVQEYIQLVKIGNFNPSDLNGYLLKKSNGINNSLYIFGNLLSDWAWKQYQSNIEYKGSIWFIPWISPSNLDEVYLLKVFYSLLDYGFTPLNAFKIIYSIPPINKRPDIIKKYLKRELGNDGWQTFNELLKEWKTDKILNTYNQAKIKIFIPREFILKNGYITIKSPLGI